MDTPWKERTRNEHSPIQSITYVQCQERSDEHESGSRIIHSPETQERKNLLRLWPGQCPRLASGFLGGWRSRQPRAFYPPPPAWWPDLADALRVYRIPALCSTQMCTSISGTVRA